MINEAQMASLITQALEAESNDPNVDPAEARERIGEQIAAAVAQFVIGRQTIVTGASSDGATVNGTGVIQE